MSEPDFVASTTEPPPSPARQTVTTIDGTGVRVRCPICVDSDFIAVVGRTSGQILDDLRHADRKHSLCGRAM